LGEKNNDIELTEAYKTEATRIGSAALATNIRNHVQVAEMEVDWATERLIRSALCALILAMLRLLKCDTEEIGEFHGHPNHVSSDFGPGQILRDLVRRAPFPHCHHREHSTPFDQHLLSDPQNRVTSNQTAIKVIDGAVEVVSEGHWKRFTP
jgi:hypothetical protein